MNQITSPAILYRLYQYSDKSAIALAFTPEYGKIKLFVQNAYSKKGTPMCFIPGSVTYSIKETSDLYRFKSFSHDPAFYHYIQFPEITMRMHLCFDFYDHLFHLGEICRVFWTLLLKYTEDNYRSLGLYTIYRLLRDAGVGFASRCACNKMQGDILLHHGEILCEACPGYSLKKQSAIQIDKDLPELLEIFPDSAAYRGKEFSPPEEVALLKIFEKHLENVNDKENILKSMGVFLNMHESGGF